MAEINLLDIKPHQVSRDLRGYTVFFYGDAKTGKTTTASKFPDALLLGFEKGWNAIPGIRAIPINSWSEFKKVLKQLQDPEVQKMYSTIIVDTADIAYDLAEKYICQNAKNPQGGFGVDNIADIGYGKGFTMVAKEFDESLRSIVQMDYGLVMISHAQDKVFTNEQGREYNKLVPTLGNKPRNIVERMSDIIGYARTVTDENGNNTTKLFMRGTNRFDAGSRFKYTPDYIDFTYKNLVDCIGDAIDKQAEEDGSEYFTNERINVYADTTSSLDFDELVDRFNNMINNIIENNDEQKMEEYWTPRITQITDRHLGRGVKVNNCSREQVEALDLVCTDLEELIKKS